MRSSDGKKIYVLLRGAAPQRECCFCRTAYRAGHHRQGDIRGGLCGLSVLPLILPGSRIPQKPPDANLPFWRWQIPARAFSCWQHSGSSFLFFRFFRRSLSSFRGFTAGLPIGHWNKFINHTFPESGICKKRLSPMILPSRVTAFFGSLGVGSFSGDDHSGR